MSTGTAQFPTATTTFEPATNWFRGEFWSTWTGPDIELIVIQNHGASEGWKWTARGWRTPGEYDGADQFGWIDNVTRDGAELAALKFYLEKD